jgi:DNA segregation ATPase FtsK/SpoIIIE-like protein
MPARSESGSSRSSRAPAARRSASRPPIAPDAPRLVIGLALMIVGVATGIALLLPGEGKLTDWWRDSIAPWVGFGRRVVPFVLLGVGWWMVNRAKGVRGDWQLTIFGAAVSFCAGLGLLELLVPTHGGLIGKALAHNLPALITPPGTAILLFMIMVGGFLLAVDMSLPTLVAPFSRIASGVVTTLLRPARGPEEGEAGSKAERVERPERLDREAVSLDPRKRAAQDRAAGTGLAVPPAVPAPVPISATFAPPVAPGGRRDALSLGETLSPPPGPATAAVTARELARLGGSVRDGGHARSSRSGEGAPGGADTATLAKPHEYRLPPLSLLDDIAPRNGDTSMDHEHHAQIIEAKLASFNIPARVVAWNAGPVVTQYEVAPSPEIKVSRIEALADDLAMALAARTIRIEAPIPGKSVVGVEIPNKDFNIVALRRILEEVDFRASSKLTFALGRDVAGHARAADLAKMPHLLIAGATGSGKSVMVNALMTSLLCNATPDEVRMIVIDLKRVELSGYNGLPHLMVPVVTETSRAKAALKWAVKEMEDRYRRFAGASARNVGAFNESRTDAADRMPYLVIIVDELADLMMREGKNVEDPIVRLAQKARATGIHMVLATQRPSVNVVTGLIKANFPSRIAFAMASQVDSRTILDMPGAEDLIGRGDMLFQPADLPRPIRLQGVFVSDKEIANITGHWRAEAEPHYDMGIVETDEEPSAGEEEPDEEADRLLSDAVNVIQEYDRASASLLQRRLKIGYARAARIIDQLEARGYVSPFDGSNARQVLRRDGAGPSRGYGASGEDEI